MLVVRPGAAPRPDSVVAGGGSLCSQRLPASCWWEINGHDVSALRRALASFRSEYSEDANGLQTGYELIANCIEQDAGYRAAAQRYFDEDPGSSLRRFVRRHCLGGP